MSLASESLGRGEARAKELRASPAERTWVEKRIVESDRRGKNKLKNELGSLEKQCLGCYIERQLERNASRPAATE